MAYNSGARQNKSYFNKMQAFQNITLRKITNTLFFVSNLTLYKNLGIKPVIAEAELFYLRFFVKLENHSNPLVRELHTFTLPGNPQRRLKRNGVMTI